MIGTLPFLTAPPTPWASPTHQGLGIHTAHAFSLPGDTGLPVITRKCYTSGRVLSVQPKDVSRVAPRVCRCRPDSSKKKQCRDHAERLCLSPALCCNRIEEMGSMAEGHSASAATSPGLGPAAAAVPTRSVSDPSQVTQLRAAAAAAQASSAVSSAAGSPYRTTTPKPGGW